MFARERAWIVAGFALGSGAMFARAQMHHVDAPQKVTRAIGVYEWTGDLNKPTASRFVPVSLFIDGRFEDAGLYLARPVPFALQTGDLYTVERSGEPEGVFDLQMAERVVTGNALADDNPAGVWYGFGRFTADAPPKPGPALHRSAHVGAIQSTPDPGKPHPSGTPDDTQAKAGTDGESDRPQMTRRTPASDPGAGAGGQDQSSGSSSKSGSGSSGSTGSGSSGGSGGDDTDRPTLARRDPSQDAARRSTSVGGKKGTASVTAVGPAPGDDPDRPTLSHNTVSTESPKELTGMPADLHQAVAVSDAVSSDPHPFTRPWEDPAERNSTLAAMEALAKPRVAAYLAENHLVPSTAPVTTSSAPQNSTPQSSEGIAANTEGGSGAPPKLQRGKPTEYGGASPSKPAAPADGRKSTTPVHRARPATRAAAGKAAGPAPLSLREEQISGYTLSYGGLPTFVYSASIPAAAASNTEGLPPAAAHPTAYVTLVAQRLPSGELQVAMGAVTDSQHLDRSPRLHLVDVVDPDASHRASMLFELRGLNSRQFALYRLVTARAENTFTSASIE